MTFDFPGYELRFIQCDRCHDDSAHLASYIFKFFSPITKYFYVVKAEYHETDVFAIKFYCKKDKRNDFKYSIIINKGDIGNVIMTCAKVIPALLNKYPKASFAFAAARSYDTNSKTIEPLYRTQRYRIYCDMIPKKFGQQTFSHHTNDDISSYLLYNRQSDYDLIQMQNMFRTTYNGTDFI